jgi:acetyl-CoA carboxylase carboxyltransferase component
VSKDVEQLIHRIHKGGAQRYHDKNTGQGKLFVRERIGLFCDEATFVEDGMFGQCLDHGLPSDAVVTGVGKVNGQTVAIMANDSTVKAGSWGPGTVEKILRIQETAMGLGCPLTYLVDSAGARITDQVKMFPGRRGAGRIFYNEVQLSGMVPQVCLLFGPSAAGGAYIPAFCDIVVMVEGNASMYLGSPRMAEMVIGETVSLEQMGGARMHCTVSGCGDILVKTEHEAISWARRYLSYMPSRAGQQPARTTACVPSAPASQIAEVIDPNESKSFNMMKVIDAVIDADSWLEIKPLFARELITGLCRIDGRTVGVIANQPKHLGGVLFVASAEKASRFIALCDAFRIPLLFLADVPGFMIGSKVEREGIIRAGARMIAEVSQATVPKISVIVRKAYGAGLYAMCGPAFSPNACIALPTASIGVMGPQAAVQAVFANKIEQVEQGPARDQLVQELREKYREDIDLLKLADDLVIDDVVPAHALREHLVRRFELADGTEQVRPNKKRTVMPM